MKSKEGVAKIADRLAAALTKILACSSCITCMDYRMPCEFHGDIDDIEKECSKVLEDYVQIVERCDDKDAAPIPPHPSSPPCPPSIAKKKDKN